MNGFSSPTRVGSGSPLTVAAAVLVVGFVLAAVVLVAGALRLKQSDQTIAVTGSARKRIVSDKVVWNAGISYQGATLAEAYQALSENVPKVKAYLIQKGIPESEITVSAIQSTTLTVRNNDGTDTGRITGYSLRQTVNVTSTDVARIEKVSREATELIHQGILLESNPPQYIYTQLATLKKEMLAEAAKDARDRAENILRSVGSRVGSVRSVRMGVMQINAADSFEAADAGINDTSSLEKDITAVVGVTFGVE